MKNEHYINTNFHIDEQSGIKRHPRILEDVKNALNAVSYWKKDTGGKPDGGTDYYYQLQNGKTVSIDLKFMNGQNCTSQKRRVPNSYDIALETVKVAHKDTPGFALDREVETGVFVFCVEYLTESHVVTVEAERLWSYVESRLEWWRENGREATCRKNRGFESKVVYESIENLQRYVRPAPTWQYKTDKAKEMYERQKAAFLQWQQSKLNVN